MKKTLLAILAGTALGVALAAATTGSSAAASNNCGPINCTATQECCVSPHPFHYRCVTPGTCPYNR
jgi:hypothetical protein